MDRVRTKGYTEEEKRQYYREYMRERRKKNTDSGKCRLCGGTPLPGKTLCELCREKRNKDQLNYAKRKTQQLFYYQVKGLTADGNMQVVQVDELPEGIKRARKLVVGDKVVKQFWRDRVAGSVLVDKIIPWDEMPRIYKKDGILYFELVDEFALTGKSPLNRFVLEGDSEVNTEGDLRLIVQAD